MDHTKIRRVRDPIYDIYRFDNRDEIDNIALALIDTPAFQRLRRIKQLGFSDYVYPGASHTRFAHSIGVFATARRLVHVIRRQGESLDDRHVKIALLAALLHDIGHGPFSHAFEAVQDGRNKSKSHESWSAEIIQSAEGGIAPILQDLAAPIARLITSDEPGEFYGAIVSSSLDADRLDYIQRDRVMSGTGTGAIDFEWLLEHVHLQEVDLAGSKMKTFTLDAKAIQQAEIFLLARYHLYDQVYLHKTNRGLECLLTECLGRLSRFVDKNRGDWLGLPPDNHLVQFLDAPSPSVEQYLRIDDTVVMAALHQIATSRPPVSGNMPNGEGLTDLGYVRDLARRILNRDKAYCLDLEKFSRDNHENYPLMVERALNLCRKEGGGNLRDGIFFDEPKLTIYGRERAGGIRDHKKLWIRAENGGLQEITNMSSVIKEHAVSRSIGRMFFLREAEREKTRAELVDMLHPPARKRAAKTPRSRT